MNMSDMELIRRLSDLVDKTAREAAVQVAGSKYPISWVKLERYVEMTGDTVDAVNARRKTGKWLEGNECKIVDGRLWVNLPAVEGWVEKWDQASPARVALNSEKGSAPSPSASNSCTKGSSAARR